MLTAKPKRNSRYNSIMIINISIIVIHNNVILRCAE